MLWPAALKSREPRPGSLFFPPSPLFVLLKSDLSRHSSRQEIRPPLTGVLSPTASLGCRGEGGVGGSWPGRTRPPPPPASGNNAHYPHSPGVSGGPSEGRGCPRSLPSRPSAIARRGCHTGSRFTSRSCSHQTGERTPRGPGRAAPGARVGESGREPISLPTHLRNPPTPNAWRSARGREDASGRGPRRSPPAASRGLPGPRALPLDARFQGWGARL